mgnify:CR=1 FL=1
MKDYEVCAYCIGMNDSVYCPCENKEDIINYDLCPADIPLAEYVKNMKE